MSTTEHIASARHPRAATRRKSASSETLKHPRPRKIWSEGVGISGSLLLFLFWPLGALGASVMRYPRGFFKTTITLFCCFYGFTMVFPTDGSDADRYIEDFHTVRQQSFSDVYASVTHVFSQKAELAEPVSTLLCAFVGCFTSDPRWIFAVFGLIFGFFYAHNLDFLVRGTRPKIHILSWLFLIGFAMLIPIFFIYGYRMWTAAHIFFFGAVRVVMQRRYHYLAVAAASMLVHFSFVAPTFVLIAYCLAGRRDLIYLLGATGALFFGQLEGSQLTPYAHYLGPVVEQRIEGYGSETYKLERQEAAAGTRWFVKRGAFLTYALYAALVCVFVLHRRKLAPELARLFSFSLLFLVFVGLVSGIPSMGRFTSVWGLFVVAFLFFLFQQGKLNHLVVLHWAMLPPLALYAVVELRIGMDFTSVDLVSSNFLLVWLSPSKMSILQLLR